MPRKHLSCCRAICLALLLACILQPALPASAMLPPDSSVPVTRIADINAGTANSLPQGLAAVDSRLFFSADDGSNGRELWLSEPPYNSAGMVADINPEGDNADPARITSIDNNVFFTANDGKHGIELWTTEPPYRQARMVKDINRGANSAFERDIKQLNDRPLQELVPIGTALFFAADDGQSGSELWVSMPPYDSASTQRVADIAWGAAGSSPHELVSIGWMLFFIADDGSNRSEIWKTEPPYSSAVRITDIYPGEDARIRELTVLEHTLFFSAYTKESGQELWKSVLPYGFEQASRVTDLSGKTSSLEPYDMVALGDTLFFSGNVSTENPGYPECGTPYQEFIHLADPDTPCSIPGSGNELWKSEPPYEATSTVRVADIFPGERSSDPQMKTVVGDSLIFSAYEQGSGQELYKIIPPYGGEDIFRIAEVNDQSGSTPLTYGSSDPEDLTVINQTLFFTATDYGEHGRELYRAEPPYFKAERITDLMPDGRDSLQGELSSIGRMLFFSAASPDYGIELFKLGGTYDYRLPNTGFAPGVVSEVPQRPQGMQYADLGDLWLEIPLLDVQTPIVGVPASQDNRWDLTWLNRQTGYLQDTAYPTWQGNTVLTAHLYLPDGSPGPFAALHNLSWGDRIIIHAWGENYLYQVRSVQTVTPDDTGVLGHKDEDWITLLTCQDYDAAQNDYRSRLAVQAVLETVLDGNGSLP